MRGALPARAYRMVVEWTRAHRDGLIENWALARDHKTVRKIAPLE